MLYGRMADEIDIEEHDVMDNPAIKSMFPDLSIIKKEFDYYDEEPSIKKEQLSSESDNQEAVNFDIQNPDSTTDLILNSIQHISEDQVPVSSTQIDSNCETNVSSYKDIKLPFHSNKIILGSKPIKHNIKDEYFETNSKLYQSTILLEDLGPYLDRSERYCKDCLILFPEKHDFNVHRETNHSNLYVSNCLPRRHKKFILIGKTKKFICTICNTFFCSSGNLNRHNKKIHANDIKKKNIFGQSQNKNENDNSTTAISDNPCFHCSKSFPSQQSLIEHLYDILESKKFVCDNCSEKFPSKDKLDEHIKTHRINENTKLKREENQLNIVDNSNFKNNQTNVTKKEKSQSKIKTGFYRCFVCSYYLTEFKYYLTHLSVKHKITKNPDRKIVSFDPKCKYCSSVYSNPSSYNTHLQKFHKLHLSKIYKVNDKNKKIKLKSSLDERKKNEKKKKRYKKNLHLQDIENKAECRNNSDMDIILLKSSIFKCVKCDIHFLSSKSAGDHSGHMELLVNWKCPLCQLIFKKDDEHLHEVQHSYSNTFTVFDISESYTKFLLKCPKCTVHFQEDVFLHHYSTCSLETPKSFYCKLCDILIDDNIRKYTHGHENKNMNLSNHTVIDSDIIILNEYNVSDKLFKRKNIENKDKNIVSTSSKKQRLSYMFCDSCKCFITKYHNQIHINGSCTHLVKYICKLCGLMLTQKAMNTHRKLHKTRKTLKLQDFDFYNLTSGKQIFPPMPQFPNCGKCGVHFVYQMTVKNHACHKTKFLKCHICQKKFSAESFQLHMNFHNYLLNNVKKCTLKQSKDKVHLIKNKSLTTLHTEDQEAKFIKHSECHPLNIFYLCNICNFAVNTYDEVIDHCQNHYNRREIEISTDICEFCNLKFHKACYEYHQNVHSLRGETKDLFTIVNFDISNFFDHDTWCKQLFIFLSEEQVNEIINNSIYKYEFRIKLKVIQDGASDLTLYKCDKCHTFVDPSCIREHAINTCLKLKKYPCFFCGLPFNSTMYQMHHEKIHERPNIGLKSYRIVLFNQEKDKDLNNVFCSHSRYVLYQCRSCDGIVEKSQFKTHNCNNLNLKKCSECGLLIYSSQYDMHISKHKEFSNFIQENIKVILFGNKNENSNIINKKLVPSFSGIVYDYTFYKCIKCQLCERNENFILDKLKHQCFFGSKTSKCSKCDLYFLIGDFKHHQTLHDNDPDFTRETIELITFDISENNKFIVKSKVFSEKQRNIKENKKKALENTSSDNTHKKYAKLNKDCDVKEKIAKLYKCSCGLHFLNESSVTTHFDFCDSTVKVSKQNCSKCNLLFNPNILFCHLLTHHGNKNHIYKFEIVEMINNKNTGISLPNSTSLISNENRNHVNNATNYKMLNTDENFLKAQTTNELEKGVNSAINVSVSQVDMFNDKLEENLPKNDV